MRPDMPQRGTFNKTILCPSSPLAGGTLLGHNADMIGDRIAGLRKAKGLSQTDLANAIGTTLNMLGKLERGDRKLDLKWLAKIAAALEVDVTELLGVDEIERKEIIPSNDNVVTLKAFDLNYSMGPGANIDDLVEGSALEFDAHLLSTITRSPVDKLFVAKGDGDSMFPTLVNDDTVVIDTAQNILNQQDRIWACSIYGLGAIKRLRAAQGGRVIVKSDNPVIEDQEVDGKDVHIIGRVVWLARRI